MKKVLMLRSNPFAPDERVYKEAKSLINNGYDVTVLCWDRELKLPQKEVFDGIKIERIGPKAGYASLKELLFKMPLFWIKLFKKAYGNEFDVVHCYDYDTLPAGVWLKLFKRKKLVYDALELFLSYTGDKLVDNGMFFIERIHLPFIDALIYTNEERLKIFLERTSLNKKTIIIHNYPELGIKPKIKADKLIFQYNGRIEKDRNIFNIVKAFKEFKNVDIIFYIIGNHYNDYGSLIKEYLKENNIKNVVFKDFIPLDELLEFLKTTYIGFVPLLKDSLNNMIPEPNKLYNYFATCNFAVVEDLPYLKKIVVDEELGISCDFSNIEDIKDKIKWILNSKENVEIMTENAYNKYLEYYNWENEEKKLVKLYKELI